MRALSTRIKNITKEMNPYPTISGMPLGSGGTKSVMIDKVYCWKASTTGSGILGVKSSDLEGIIPDGGKIMAIKITSLGSRYLQVTVPSGSALMLTQDQAASAPLPPLARFNIAPLSRFPVVKVNIPDLLAKPIDTQSSTTTDLFTVAVSPAATSELILRFHVKIAI